MKKRLIPTALALLVLIVLLVYANYFETSVILAPGAQKPELILGCQAAEITSIAWIRGGEIEYKLVIASDSCYVMSPQQMAADRSEAEGLARHFAELRYEMVVAESATDTTDYGIDDNSPIVVIEAGERSWELCLGNKSEIAGSVYLACKGDTRVFMVPGYIRGDFAKKIDEVRDRRWFREKLGQITQISIATPESAVELRLGDSYSEWFIDQPASFSADGVAVAEWLERLRNFKISNFVVDEPPVDEPPVDADYGFNQPSLVVTATNRQGNVFAFAAGETAGTETYIRKTGEIAVHASRNSEVAEFKRDVNDLRDKYLVLPERDKITEITVADASASITIEKKDDRWLVGNQVIADADVKAFLNSLGKSRIFSFMTPEKLAEHGLSRKESCRYVDIRESASSLTLWMGTRQGVNLSVLNGNELMFMSAEAEDAHKLLMHRISREQAVNAVVFEPETSSKGSVAEPGRSQDQ